MSQRVHQSANTADQKRENERHHDRWVDYVKHLTTLSTGSIVLQVAFLDKFLPNPIWRGLIVLSLGCLGASVIASVAAYTMLLQSPRIMSAKEQNILANLIIVIWLSFLTGIIALGAFGIRNILTR